MQFPFTKKANTFIIYSNVNILIKSICTKAKVETFLVFLSKLPSKFFLFTSINYSYSFFFTANLQEFVFQEVRKSVTRTHYAQKDPEAETVIVLFTLLLLLCLCFLRNTEEMKIKNLQGLPLHLFTFISFID